MSESALPQSRTLVISSWVLRIVLAALFILAAFAKLSGQPMMVAEFGQVGLGQWFRFVTAILELSGAVALLAPPTAIYGAGLLLLVDIGAFIAQVTRIHMDFIHTFVIGAFLAGVILIERRRR